MTAAERISVLEIVDRYWAQDRHGAGHETALKAAGARFTPLNKGEGNDHETVIRRLES